MTPEFIILTYHQSINPATALPVDAWLFTVPTGAEYEIVEALETHTVAGSDGSAVTADVVKAAAGTAPGSGTSMLSSTFNLKSTANTPVDKIKGSGLATTQVARIIRSGQQLGINFGGTLTALAGCAITVVLKTTRKASNR